MGGSIFEQSINRVTKLPRKAEGLQHHGDEFPFHPVIGFFKVKKEHGRVLLGVLGPVHGFPTSDQVFEDIPAFDKTSLGRANKIGEDVLNSERQELGKNFVGNIEEGNRSPVFDEGLIPIFGDHLNYTFINGASQGTPLKGLRIQIKKIMADPTNVSLVELHRETIRPGGLIIAERVNSFFNFLYREVFGQLIGFISGDLARDKGAHMLSEGRGLFRIFRSKEILIKINKGLLNAINVSYLLVINHNSLNILISMLTLKEVEEEFRTPVTKLQPVRTGSNPGSINFKLLVLSKGILSFDKMRGENTVRGVGLNVGLGYPQIRGKAFFGISIVFCSFLPDGLKQLFPSKDVLIPSIKMRAGGKSVSVNKFNDVKGSKSVFIFQEASVKSELRVRNFAPERIAVKSNVGGNGMVVGEGGGGDENKVPMIIR